MNIQDVYIHYNTLKKANGGSLTQAQKTQFQIDIGIARGIAQCGSVAAYQDRIKALELEANAAREREIANMSGQSPVAKARDTWINNDPNLNNHRTSQ